MRVLLTGEEMRTAEAAAMKAGVVTGLQLMARAGAGVVAAIEEVRSVAADESVVVLCGPGNNGGDGFVIARLMAAAGWRVALFLFGDVARLPLDAAENARIWVAGGGAIGNVAGAQEAVAQAAIIVDALFGIGLKRGLPPVLVALAGSVAEARGRGAYVVSVDVPSGLCADSGRVIGDVAIAADMTVTFHAEKTGHRLADGPMLCGTLRVVDIGLEPSGGQVTLVEFWSRELRSLGKGTGHKFVHGHAVVVSGGVGFGGAARLAARGALRTGAGLVTLAVPPAAMAENAAQVTAVMLTPGGSSAALPAFLTDRRINALCIGPGLPPGGEAAALLQVCLGAERPCVIDAGALSQIAGDPGLRAMVHRGCVLTPHDGEFARLWPDLAQQLEGEVTQGPAFSRIDATRAAAARIGGVVVLKGPDTVIAAPDGRVRLHSAAYGREAGWLATAGSGDVFAGIVTGLIARGMDAFEAAAMGAWLHVEAARAFGPGLIAEDLPEMLPAVFRAAGL